MIETIGKFIIFQDSYINKDAIESVNLYSNDKTASFVVTISTRMMTFNPAFTTKDEQQEYVKELISLLNE